MNIRLGAGAKQLNTLPVTVIHSLDQDSFTLLHTQVLILIHIFIITRFGYLLCYISSNQTARLTFHIHYLYITYTRIQSKVTHLSLCI